MLPTQHGWSQVDKQLFKLALRAAALFYTTAGKNRT
jgi:hypothetical protein